MSLRHSHSTSRQPSKKIVAYAAAAAAASFLQASGTVATSTETPTKATISTATSASKGIHSTLWGGSNDDTHETDLLAIPRGGTDETQSEAETEVKPSKSKQKKKKRSKKGNKLGKDKKEKHQSQPQPTSDINNSKDDDQDADTADTDSPPEPSSTQQSNPMVEEIMQHEDYYDILGLPRGEDNVSKIKKNYRRRAVKVHPDKTGGDRRAFDKLAEAYDVLLDDEKRPLYNRFGKEGLDPTKGGGGMEDFVRNFFAGGHHPFGQAQQQRPKVNRTVKYQLEVTLEDLYRGSSRHVTVEAPSEMRGWQYPHDPYQDEEKSKDVEIAIPRGSHAGQSIVLSGEMDFDSHDSPPGDLIFQILQRPHKMFTRKGHDLAIELKISFQEAICGCIRAIHHLDGRQITLESAKHKIHNININNDDNHEAPPSVYIQTGDIQVIKGLGMPKNAQGTEFGDLYVQYQVELPKSGSSEHLTTSERIELARLLDKLDGPHGRHKKSHHHASDASSSYTLQRASLRDFGRASGPVSFFEEDDHHHSPFGGAGAHRQFFWSSSSSGGQSPFFGQETDFEDGTGEEHNNVQCRQM